MKKYLGFFVLFLMVLLLNVPVVLAKDGEPSDDSIKSDEIKNDDVKSDDIDIESSVRDRQKVEATIKPFSAIKDEAQLRLKAAEDARKAQRDELKQKREEELKALQLERKAAEEKLKAEREDARKEFEAEKDRLLGETEVRGELPPEVKTALEAKKAELKDKIESIKTEAENVREKISATIETTREAAKQKMEELKNQIKTEKDATKAKLAEDRITGREHALERFDGAVEKLDTLAGRINEQITKLEAKGVSVADAAGIVAIAETKIDGAKTKIAEINAILAGSTEQLSTEDKAQLRTLTEEVRVLVKDAHLNLSNAVKSLKDSVRAYMDSQTAPAETDSAEQATQ